MAFNDEEEAKSCTEERDPSLPRGSLPTLDSDSIFLSHHHPRGCHVSASVPFLELSPVIPEVHRLAYYSQNIPGIISTTLLLVKTVRLCFALSCTCTLRIYMYLVHILQYTCNRLILTTCIYMYAEFIVVV